eukprot:COSAG02_NODE_602_length_19711_cov_20.882674_10_plen_202_part_00
MRCPAEEARGHAPSKILRSSPSGTISAEASPVPRTLATNSMYVVSLYASPIPCRPACCAPPRGPRAPPTAPGGGIPKRFTATTTTTTSPPAPSPLARSPEMEGIVTRTYLSDLGCQARCELIRVYNASSMIESPTSRRNFGGGCVCALKSESESEMLVSQKEKQGRTVEVPLHLFSEVLTVDSHRWERGHDTLGFGLEVPL